jgi:hypothetical protein
MRLDISAIEAINYALESQCLVLGSSKEIQHFCLFQNGSEAHFQIVGRAVSSGLNKLECESDHLLPR